MSKQAFAILPKVREADSLMKSSLQRRVVEAHPELGFWSLNRRRPMEHTKRRQAGREERERLLSRVFVNDVAAMSPPPGAARDDFYDACIAAWTASRLARGLAKRIPARPPLDGRGLRMEIVY